MELVKHLSYEYVHSFAFNCLKTQAWTTRNRKWKELRRLHGSQQHCLPGIIQGT